MPDKPLCFVLMPFGSKPDPGGRPDIDFDRIWNAAIRPAIEDAGLQPIRADEEKTGGIIHKAMFERLLLCEYAIADLTTANANVFYELGVRHTARPFTTQAIFAKNQPIPFDVNFLRSLPYELGDHNRFGDEEADALRRNLAARLLALRQRVKQDASADSPVFQLLGEWQPADLARLKTDVFRDRVQVSEGRRERMISARAKRGEEGLAGLDALRAELGDLEAEEAGVVIDLLLSYRALKAWTRMIDLYEAMPVTLARQILAREQLAFALNRRAGAEDRPQDRARALQVLEDVEEEQGPSSETCGLIGRIYKDLWDQARGEKPHVAAGHLDEAIAAYVRGFEADPRDAYPGINALTLLDVRGDDESQELRDALLPVVRFAVRQRLRGKTPDYWDYATMLELAVLDSDPKTVQKYLGRALAKVREVWEPETTARNLGLIRKARAERGEDVAWLDDVIAALKESS